MQWLRTVGVVVLAVIAGGAVIAITEAAGHALFAPARTSAAGAYGPAVYVVALVAWALGTAVGVHIVARLRPADARVLVPIVVVMFVALAVVNLVSLPHPIWMLPGAVVAFGVGALAGIRTSPAHNGRARMAA